MREIVECYLKIVSVIDGKEESQVVEGKGNYIKDNEGVMISFSNNENEYRFRYKEDVLTIFFNDSKYNFILNSDSYGEIKNGDYLFKITTYASKIEVNNNLINIDYILRQNNNLIGSYKMVLSFK